MSDTFTIGEMREAWLKMLRGEPLTAKEKTLAEAKGAAIRRCIPDNEYMRNYRKGKK